MSRERARLRAEREEALAAARAKRQREAERRAVRAGHRRRAVDALPRPVRTARPRGILESRRRRRWEFAVGIVVLIQLATFFLTDSWLMRGTILMLSLLFAPVILTLIADRRS